MGPAEVRAWIEAGRAAEAESRLRLEFATDPANVDTLQLLGHLHFLRGDFREAARLTALAIERAPQVAFLRGNLAEAFAALGRTEDAEEQHRAAAALAPDSVEIRLGLARFLAGRGKSAEALDCARQVLARAPCDAAASSIAATALAQLGEVPQAIEILRKGQGGGAWLRVQRFRLEAEICDWSQDRSQFARLVERWAASPRDVQYEGLHPFVAWHVDVPDAARLAVSQGYADRVAARARPLHLRRSTKARRAGRLRLGYLSADFHHHPTMHLTRGLFAAHDRGRFEVYAYSLGPDDGSEYRRHVRTTADAFVDLRAATADEGARRIASDQIDVLIDMKGFTFDARPEILAARAAPVQLTWLGYPATLGAGLVDYAIVDGVVAPKRPERQFGESLIRLPHSYQMVDVTAAPAGDAPSRSAFGLPGDAVVFASFNAAYKIEPRIFGAWMRILERVEGSVLWLYRSNRWCEPNLRREAQARGIDPARLVFADTLTRQDHLVRLRCADIVLDPQLINAHTGAADALLAAVPLLTCPGSGFPSRVAASVLAAAGQGRLICTSLDAYENLAVELARSPQERAAIRAQLARRSAPYFDTARFMRCFEQGIEIAWRRHLDGLAPEDFDVPDQPC